MDPQADGGAPSRGAPTSAKKLYVVLEQANLETIKVGERFELLNSEDHATMLRKRKREANEARPDITHQCLLALLDSPLNRAGMLQVYIHTANNVLIEVHPSTRIPRTFRRFSFLMVQLLHKLSVHAADGPDKLLRVVKNPVTAHLPPGCRRVGFEFDTPTCAHVRHHLRGLLRPGAAADPAAADALCVVVGAMAHGNVAADYIDSTISISQYPLSAAVTCGKLCDAMEELWGVL
jgi:rRNA small subunit pseudouridine methyltransferase Nep1